LGAPRQEPLDQSAMKDAFCLVSTAEMLERSSPLFMPGNEWINWLSRNSENAAGEQKQ
jgi:hypothetical protein